MHHVGGLGGDGSVAEHVGHVLDQLGGDPGARPRRAASVAVEQLAHRDSRRARAPSP